MFEDTLGIHGNHMKKMPKSSVPRKGMWSRADLSESWKKGKEKTQRWKIYCTRCARLYEVGSEGREEARRSRQARATEEMDRVHVIKEFGMSRGRCS